MRLEDKGLEAVFVGSVRDTKTRSLRSCMRNRADSSKRCFESLNSFDRTVELLEAVQELRVSVCADDDQSERVVIATTMLWVTSCEPCEDLLVARDNPE